MQLSYPLPYQHGIALVVVMTFLLVLSLIAVSGLESALLESRMVATRAHTEQALASAEYGLKLGEEAVRTVVSDAESLPIDAPDLFYPLNGDGAIDPSQSDWSRIPVKGVNRQLGVEYVVQYAGQVSVPLGDISGKIKPATSLESGNGYLFIVTARAEQHGTVRLVQSVYVSSSAP